MPWFGKKNTPSPPQRPRWLDDPNNIEAYPEKFHAKLYGQRQKLIELIDQEYAKLTSLRLPLPQQITTIGCYACYYDPNKLVSVDITAPQWQFPPHAYFPFLRLPLNEDEQVGVNALCQELGYLVLARDEAEAEQIEAYKIRDHLVFYQASGLLKALAHPGRWFTRDPYGFFKMYHHHNWSDPARVYLPLLEERQCRAEECVLMMKRLAFFGLSLPRERFSYSHLFFQAYSGQEDRLPLRTGYHFLQLPLEDNLPPAVVHQLPLPVNDFPAEYVRFKVLPTLEAKAAVSKQFLESLHSKVSSPVAFEITYTGVSCFVQLICSSKDAASLSQLLRLYFPESGLEGIQDYADNKDTSYSLLAATPQYARYSLKAFSEFTVDPYRILFSLLEDADPASLASIQVSFSPLAQATVKMIKDAVYDAERDAKPLTDKEPAWIAGVTVRTNDSGLLENIKQHFLAQYETAKQPWAYSAGTTSRLNEPLLLSYNIVSTAELAALAHFPTKDAASELLEAADMQSALPPPLFTEEKEGGVLLGHSEHRGKKVAVYLPQEVRARHVYVIGKSGSGKSTLLFNLALQDIERGAGLTVIDPHGDLVEDLLNYIPKEAIEEAIYLDASDTRYPVALNIFNAKSEEEIALLCDDLIVTFRRLSDSWGERMENILRYVFHTLLRIPNTTFLDIQTILENPKFREVATAKVTHPTLVNFWRNIFPKLPKDATQPILSRMSKFSLTPSLRALLSSPQSKLNFSEVIHDRKILLVNLAKGKVGQDSASLIGSIIVSQLQMAIMRQAAIPREQRIAHTIYCDEFQNFTTSAFETILSEARKYKLGLVLAHQYMSQLADQMRGAILGTVGTQIMFSVGKADAQYLSGQIGKFSAEDLFNLPNFQALCKPSTQAKDTFRFQTLPPPPRPQSFAQEVMAHTRRFYGSPTAPVAAEVQSVELEEDGWPVIPPPDFRTPTGSEPTVTVQAPPPSVTAGSQVPISSPSPAQGVRRPRRMKIPRIATAPPKEFKTYQEQILHFVAQAEYLSTRQIIELCFESVAESARAQAASRELRELVSAKKLNEKFFNRGKIYFTAKSVNPTDHNVAIRDLYVKIINSGYALGEVQFYPLLAGLNPDLAIQFIDSTGQPIQSYWEIDLGTEGMAELLSKVERYGACAPDALVVFVFAERARLEQFQKKNPDPTIALATLPTFRRINDAVFDGNDKQNCSLFALYS